MLMLLALQQQENTSSKSSLDRGWVDYHVAIKQLKEDRDTYKTKVMEEIKKKVG